MVHVFIVNRMTFKYHLEYSFAGTGAKDKLSTFLSNPNVSNYNAATERNLVGMIADISRIRANDKIIFYLTSGNNSEGLFFGTFKAVNTPFFDENNNQNYLHSEMGKGLSYRVNIIPDIVYAKGITEHQYLDSLEGINQVSDMCWSLIYRKLKGNRGCTMITDKEYVRLKNLLKKANNNIPLQIDDECGLTFNLSNNEIELGEKHSYLGLKNAINIKDRLIYKFGRSQAFETHLQAYILKNIDVAPLKDLLLKDGLQTWIGNEVSCGVGMQRIDILTIQEDENNVYVNIIELKCGEAYSDIVNKQLPWYINWFNDYICPTYDKHIIIQPVVLTYETLGIANNAVVNCNKLKENAELKPVKNIFFKIENNDISFRIL